MNSNPECSNSRSELMNSALKSCDLDKGKKVIDQVSLAEDNCNSDENQGSDGSRSGTEKQNSFSSIKENGEEDRLRKPRGNRTYLEVLTGVCKIEDKIHLDFIPNIDKQLYKFDLSDVAAEFDEWNIVLLGGVIGPNISVSSMIDFAKANWKVSVPNVILKSNVIWIFKFGSTEDRDWVETNGPRIIDGIKPLTLKIWETGMNISWDVFEAILVWIILPNLDPVFYSYRMLSAIGSMIGIPVCMDNFTTSKRIISYARILVKVTVEEARRKVVMLEDSNGKRYIQEVIFEWIPWFCTHCGIFGHRTDRCRNHRGREAVKDNLKGQTTKVWVRKNNSILGSGPYEETVTEADRSKMLNDQTVMLESDESNIEENGGLCIIEANLAKTTSDSGNGGNKNRITKNPRSRKTDKQENKKTNKVAASKGQYDLRQRVALQKGIPFVVVNKTASTGGPSSLIRKDNG